MMDVLSSEKALVILREAKSKLNELGIPSMITPCDLPNPYGMTFSLNIASTELGVNAASAAQTQGGMVAYTDPKLFAERVKFVEKIKAVDEINNENLLQH